MIEWYREEDNRPSEFVSVLGFMPDAHPFPSVRECYRIGDRYFFPALKSFEHISLWAEIPTPKELGV